MAYTSGAKLIADIKQDVGRIANKIARGVAEVAAIEMKQAHSEIMNSFYAGYSPVDVYHYTYTTPEGMVYSGKSHGYRRTWNLRYGSFEPKGVIPSGKHSFKATVNIGSSGMSDYVNSTGHSFPASGVFDLMWNQSIRGLPPGNKGYVGAVNISAAPAGVPISGSPDESMTQFVDNWGMIRGIIVADQIANSV